MANYLPKLDIIQHHASAMAGASDLTWAKEDTGWWWLVEEPRHDSVAPVSVISSD